MSFAQMFFSFRGRINRAQFWSCGLFTTLLFLGLGAIGIKIQDHLYSTTGPTSPLLGILYMAIPLGALLILYMEFAIGVKRLHDTDKSAWLLLLTIIPILNILFILIACGFAKGDEGDNKYGPPPTK